MDLIPHFWQISRCVPRNTTSGFV